MQIIAGIYNSDVWSGNNGGCRRYSIPSCGNSTQQWSILFYFTSATGRAHSISKTDIDITRLSDARGPTLINSGFAGAPEVYLRLSRFNTVCHAAFSILILTIVSAISLTSIFRDLSILIRKLNERSLKTKYIFNDYNRNRIYREQKVWVNYWFDKKQNRCT